MGDGAGSAGWRDRLRAVFDLAGDQADAETIDATVRAGVEFRGTNLWLLIFATVIASVGLNVNSTAVVIGAMLVSPLMGPIQGVGYGAAVNDFALIRRAGKNLAMAVAFSLLTSAAYFLVTPLGQARSEILARTSPAVWDVLIAAFGGLAGVVGLTRRERSNVLPGVAIATALMPPLCTAGYGLASLHVSYAIGALYLFSINSVFIAAATLVMARLMRLPEVAHVDAAARARGRRVIAVVVFATTAPAVWLAAGLVRQELFVSRAQEALALVFPRELGTFVVGQQIDPVARTISVTVVGEPVSAERQAGIEQALAARGVVGGHLEVVQARREEIDVAGLRAQLAGDLRRDALVALDAARAEIEELHRELDARERDQGLASELTAEVRALFPSATRVAIGSGTAWEDGAAADLLMVGVTLPEPLPEVEVARLEGWLGARTRRERVQVMVSASPAPRGEGPGAEAGPVPEAP